MYLLFASAISSTFVTYDFQFDCVFKNYIIEFYNNNQRKQRILEWTCGQGVSEITTKNN
jgi:hypothetical protein